ncbi:MAG: hypothetical protein JNM88_15420, partial [Chitinophagaceae bacterium]|nr:hypothetical protein [Chitinophagaceae bacterium]
MRKTLTLLLFFFMLQSADAQKINVAKIQAVYEQIKAAGIQHPDFVIAQCLQETGNLNCKKCCLR